MITRAHVMLQSKNADADRGFFREVLGFPNVDVGGGWLIFALPPAEVAVHPAGDNGGHELYLMCDDVQAFIQAMKKKKIACSKVTDQGWGLLTTLALPGGGNLGVYEPRHASPGAATAAAPASKTKAGKAPAQQAAPKARKTKSAPSKAAAPKAPQVVAKKTKSKSAQAPQVVAKKAAPLAPKKSAKPAKKAAKSR